VRPLRNRQVATRSTTLSYFPVRKWARGSATVERTASAPSSTCSLQRLHVIAFVPRLRRCRSGSCPGGSSPGWPCTPEDLQIVSDDAESDPTLHPCRPAISTSAESITPLERADAAFASRHIPISKPALLVQRAVRQNSGYLTVSPLLSITTFKSADELQLCVKIVDPAFHRTSVAATRP
jgi:hypothetical protein